MEFRARLQNRSLSVDKFEENPGIPESHHVQALTLSSFSVQIESALAAVNVELKGTFLAYKVGGGLPMHTYRPDATARCGACEKTEPKEAKFKVCSKCKRIKDCSGEIPYFTLARWHEKSHLDIYGESQVPLSS